VIARLLAEEDEDPERDEAWSPLPLLDEAELLGVPFDSEDVAAKLFEDLRVALACPDCSRTIVTFKSMRIEPSLAVVPIDEDTCGGLLIVVEARFVCPTVDAEEC
jgi:hypothetical protein